MTERSILKNKMYLYLTEFFAGMSVMAVELGASRLLAPYFSSSQIVWTIIIGTIMIAMALGNIYGGKTADKNPDPDKLYVRILIAAVWIAAIPAVGKYIILAISGVLILTVSNNLLIIAAFLACMVIFVFPLFLLGTVTPSLAKYTMDNLSDSGSIVGRLGAYNTIGSIIGTFAPTFITIPTVGTSVTFLLFAAVLLALGLIYFLSAKTKKTLCLIVCALYILCAVFGSSSSFAFWESNLLYEGESVYNYLQVKENDDSVILSTNVLFGVQSILKKNEGLTGMYYDYALAAPLMNERFAAQELSVLILGMGTGTYAKQLLHYFPDCHIEGVEIDEKITMLAHSYFELNENIPVTTYDGRAYLQATDEKYDLIMVDAYADITIPFQMSSVEFFTLVREHLSENGVMVVNMNMHSDKAGNINDYLTDTIASVFDNVYTANVPRATNRELFASQNPEMLACFDRARAELTDPELSELFEQVASALTNEDGGELILTDDRAAVEVLGMQMIDDLIKNELGYYKELFKKEGIKGILNQM